MIAARKLTVTLKTVTPLFLGGANPQGTPELRPTAFRGAIRYWLRAALGGAIGDGNLKGLRQLEGTVFGSQECGSPIVLRLNEFSSNKELVQREERILPHKNVNAFRKSFSEGQMIDLTMQQIRIDDEEVWNAACSALCLMLSFGGVGLRSRRGYGTLSVIRTSDPQLVRPTPSSFGEWIKHITEVVNAGVLSARTLAQSRNISISNLPKGPASYPCATQKNLIRICYANENSAMDAVIKFMKSVPKDQALGWIRPGQRQASPLWVRPVEMDRRYGLLFATLASKFEGQDYRRVDEFLQKFGGRNITVNGWNA